MSFTAYFDAWKRGEQPLAKRVESFVQLLGPKSDMELEALAMRAHQTTLKYFGRTIRLFAPLYLSNECINNCKYCGFSRDNNILRVTLTPAQVMQEARFLAKQGFRSILLVSGEHPKFASSGYMNTCIRLLTQLVPSIALEIGPAKTEEYQAMVQAGAEGLTVYQETYDREVYADLHTSGPKRNFNWRLETPERAYAAGFRQIGIGALFGLADWKSDALALAVHLDYLRRTCWKSHFSISIPRIRPAAGGFQPQYGLNDRNFVQLLCALRITFPSIGITLSTRESASFRESVLPLGITTMSAGSHTEPGGYTQAGRENLHHTIRGNPVKIEHLSEEASATEQFTIADSRSPKVIVDMLRNRGFEPVWKDWDTALLP